MTFKDALIKAQDLQNLIGQYKCKDATLNEIIIAPSNPNLYEIFIKEYLQTLNPQQAIIPYLNGDCVVMGVFDKWRIEKENVLSVLEF